MLPWLLVGALRSLVATAVAYSCGIYICSAYKFSKPVCADFILAEIVEYGPSIYTWFCVLSFYRNLNYVNKTLMAIELKEGKNIFESLARGRRAKTLSIPEEDDCSKVLLKLEDDRHLISASTIENVVNQIGIKANESRSLDSLLQTITTEAEKQEIMRLNYDLREEIEKDDQLSISQKIAKLLELTPSEISKAQKAKLERNTAASDVIDVKEGTYR